MGHRDVNCVRWGFLFWSTEHGAARLNCVILEEASATQEGSFFFEQVISAKIIFSKE